MPGYLQTSEVVNIVLTTISEEDKDHYIWEGKDHANANHQVIVAYKLVMTEVGGDPPDEECSRYRI